jgi:hypothetical protein
MGHLPESPYSSSGANDESGTGSPDTRLTMLSPEQRRVSPGAPTRWDPFGPDSYRSYNLVPGPNSDHLQGRGNLAVGTDADWARGNGVYHASEQSSAPGGQNLFSRVIEPLQHGPSAISRQLSPLQPRFLPMGNKVASPDPIPNHVNTVNRSDNNSNSSISFAPRTGEFVNRPGVQSSRFNDASQAIGQRAPGNREQESRFHGYNAHGLSSTTANVSSNGQSLLHGNARVAALCNLSSNEILRFHNTESRYLKVKSTIDFPTVYKIRELLKVMGYHFFYKRNRH